jgi:hypothetical protein
MDNLRRQIQQLQEHLERYEASKHEAPPHGLDVKVPSDDEMMLIPFTSLVVTTRVTALHLILET